MSFVDSALTWFSTDSPWSPRSQGEPQNSFSFMTSRHLDTSLHQRLESFMWLLWRFSSVSSSRELPDFFVRVVPFMTRP